MPCPLNGRKEKRKFKGAQDARVSPKEKRNNRGDTPYHWVGSSPTRNNLPRESKKK